MTLRIFGRFLSLNALLALLTLLDLLLLVTSDSFGSELLPEAQLEHEHELWHSEQLQLLLEVSPELESELLLE